MSKQNISSIVSGAGFAASFWVALDKAARKRGLKDEDIYTTLKETSPLIDRFVELMVGTKSVVRAFAKIVATFSITCVGGTASELIKRGRYEWVNGDITDERFPVKPHASVIRKIELVEFVDHDPSSNEVLAEFKRLGLERPTHEDVLQFGVEHPEEQRKRPIVFLHEPVPDSRGSLYVLVLDGFAGSRVLGLYLFDGRWHRSFLFAGVRK